jgi:hypothetical protein
MVVHKDEHKNVRPSAIQQKKVGCKAQQDVHKMRSEQSKQKRDVVKSTAKGEQKMKTKNWNYNVANFAAKFTATATLVAKLNMGMSVAP